MIFLDTSVLVPIAQVGHTHHLPSAELWKTLADEDTAVSAHALAEIYSTLTGMPPKFRLTPTEAVPAVETFLQRLTPVTLSAAEYIDALRGTARLGHSSGMVEDALHLACGRKIGARKIYTWNVRSFRSLAPTWPTALRRHKATCPTHGENAPERNVSEVTINRLPDNSSPIRS